VKAFVNIRANVIEWKEVLGLSNLCLRNDLKLMGSQVVLMEFCMCMQPTAIFWTNFGILLQEGVWSWWEGINYAPALAAATVGIVLAQRATATAIAVACVLTAKGCHTWCSILYFIKSRQRTSLVLVFFYLLSICYFLGVKFLNPHYLYKCTCSSSKMQPSD